jgi:hypothetical protein
VYFGKLYFVAFVCTVSRIIVAIRFKRYPELVTWIESLFVILSVLSLVVE